MIIEPHIRGAIMKYLALTVFSLFGFIPSQTMAADLLPAEAVSSTQKAALDYSEVYSAIQLQASQLGGVTENNVRYSVLFQIVGLDIQNEGDVVAALEALLNEASNRDDALTAAVIAELLTANSDENSDIAAILAGLKGLPPIPTPPPNFHKNTSSSDY